MLTLLGREESAQASVRWRGDEAEAIGSGFWQCLVGPLLAKLLADAGDATTALALLGPLLPQAAGNALYEVELKLALAQVLARQGDAGAARDHAGMALLRSRKDSDSASRRRRSH